MWAAAARASGNSFPQFPQAMAGAALFLEGFAALRARFDSVLALPPFGPDAASTLVAAFWRFVAPLAVFSGP